MEGKTNHSKVNEKNLPLLLVAKRAAVKADVLKIMMIGAARLFRLWLYLLLRSLVIIFMIPMWLQAWICFVIYIL